MKAKDGERYVSFKVDDAQKVQLEEVAEKLGSERKACVAAIGLVHSLLFPGKGEPDFIVANLLDHYYRERRKAELNGQAEAVAAIGGSAAASSPAGRPVPRPRR